MLTDFKQQEDLADTEKMLITLAKQDSLVQKKVVIVIMERVVQHWIELKIQLSPNGNWQFTESDRNELHQKPKKIKDLLNIIESRANTIH